MNQLLMAIFKHFILNNIIVFNNNIIYIFSIYYIYMWKVEDGGRHM